MKKINQQVQDFTITLCGYDGKPKKHNGMNSKRW
jgi:hypothetical protein